MRNIMLVLAISIHSFYGISQQLIEFEHNQTAQLSTVAFGDQAIFLSDALQLNPSPAVVGGTPPYIFSWSPDIYLDNPNIANPIASPTETISYTFQVSDQNACTASNTFTIVVADPLSVSSALQGVAILYPNPAKDFCLIRWPYSQPAMLEIIDINGRQIRTGEMSNEYGEQLLINTSQLPEGVYLLRISNQEKQEHFKLIIQ
jgi:hypothetical protein